MTPEQYAAAQYVIARAVLLYTQQFAKYFRTPALSTKDWLGLLQMLFPRIQQSREQSARLARQFYDSQRSLHLPDLPTHLVDLEGTDFPTFVQSMEPARPLLRKADSPEHASVVLGLRAVRETENAGRRQIINAVESDEAALEQVGKPSRVQPPSGAENVSQISASTAGKTVRGWARVATGRETCAWCLMLVSRGPVYASAEAAGLDLDNHDALMKDAAGTDVSGAMNQWHPGCDCIVVPVYKSTGWPGQEAQKRALQLWNEATKVAIQEEEDDPDRTHDAGVNKGDEFTRNQRAINALRRRLADGSISTSEFAGLDQAA